MQHKIASVVTWLSHYNAHVVALVIALTLVSGVFIHSADATGRKSRSGRWTQILGASLQVEAIPLTVKL